jgi:hypothetical protein
MKHLILSATVLILLAACTSQQTRDALHALPYNIAKEACRGASNCTFKDTSDSTAPPKPAHWYEDGYGRDERVQRR